MGHINLNDLSTLELPAPPQSLAQVSSLLDNDEVNMLRMSQLIETDMALAAAVMKTVSSPLYGLRGRATNVQQAITFLGTRDVAALVYQVSLRGAFPGAAELQPMWERSAVRALLMGRLAKEVYMDVWCAHTAGLFEECGKAVLFKLAPDTYRPMLKAAKDDFELAAQEQAAFGVSHDVLGARLCEAWGLDAGAVACVRWHLETLSTRRLPMKSPRRAISVISALVHTLSSQPDQLEDMCAALAPQAMLDQAQLLKGARRVKQKVDEALAGD
jgi:HD-like signal output (HDOD) protein